jgi:hypothetical protein
VLERPRVERLDLETRDRREVDGEIDSGEGIVRPPVHVSIHTFVEAEDELIPVVPKPAGQRPAHLRLSIHHE